MSSADETPAFAGVSGGKQTVFTANRSCRWKPAS